MGSPAKYRKRPVEVEAVQFTGTNHDDVAAFMGCDCGVKAIKADCPYDHSLAGPRALFIRTLEGSMRADRGDWIIRGVKGEFYPCKPDIFAATYEPAQQHPVQVEGADLPKQIRGARNLLWVARGKGRAVQHEAIESAIQLLNEVLPASQPEQEKRTDGAPDPTEGLPPELARALRDPSIIIDRDREITLADGRSLAEHLEGWRDAPSNTVSADPRYIAPSLQPEQEKEPGGALLPFERLPEFILDPDHFNLCGNCGGIAHVSKWTALCLDEATGERVPYTGTDEAPWLRCPHCKFDHDDDDAGPGLWAGTSKEMLTERRSLLAEADSDWAAEWRLAAEPGGGGDLG